MNQQKVGSFLRELRKEKQLTQEQLAEKLGVSRRTVSRWETGSNMPDLDVLIEMADYYDVQLRELLDGERKSDQGDEELNETVLKVADYSNDEKVKLTKRMHLLFIAGCIASVVYFASLFLEPDDPSAVFSFFQGMSLGISFGMVIVGVIITSKNAYNIRTFKLRLLKRIGAE